MHKQIIERGGFQLGWNFRPLTITRAYLYKLIIKNKKKTKLVEHKPKLSETNNYF